MKSTSSQPKIVEKNSPNPGDSEENAQTTPITQNSTNSPSKELALTTPTDTKTTIAGNDQSPISGGDLGDDSTINKVALETPKPFVHIWDFDEEYQAINYLIKFLPEMMDYTVGNEAQLIVQINDIAKKYNYVLKKIADDKSLYVVTLREKASQQKDMIFSIRRYMSLQEHYQPSYDRLTTIHHYHGYGSTDYIVRDVMNQSYPEPCGELLQPKSSTYKSICRMLNIQPEYNQWNIILLAYGRDETHVAYVRISINPNFVIQPKIINLLVS